MKLKGTEIKVTIDYDKFSFSKENRPIKQAHVNALRRSMEIEDLGIYNPIVVNEKFVIIDGQHSFLARKDLGFLIYYIVGQGLDFDAMKILNVNAKRWTVPDYLHAYLKKGLESYKVYAEFLEKYELPHFVNMLLLNKNLVRSKRTEKSFKSGEFEVTSLDEAIKIADLIQDFKPYFEKYRNQAFLMAAIKMINSPIYNHEEMLHKLGLVGIGAIKEHSSYLEYLRELEGIYNFNRKSGEFYRFF